MMLDQNLTPAQIAALADLADDAAGVAEQPLPEWMTADLPEGDFEPIATRVELERHLLAEAVIVATDNRSPCPTV